MPNRHRSRELVVQWIYQWALNPVDFVNVDKKMSSFWSEHTEDASENRGYFERVCTGVLQELPQIDKRIETVLDNWRLDRLEKVDLAILRVGTFEIAFESSDDRADAPVIIDEAVEIAKKFGTRESPSFINGILDKVRLDRKGQKTE
jgi:N utilization substance protein B